MSGAWVFPLGHFLGEFHPGPDEPVAYQRIRIGADELNLTSDLGEVWKLAHGLPTPPGLEALAPEQKWTRELLVDLVRLQGDEKEPEEAVARLLDTGALVEVGPGGLEPETFARGHRLQPLLVGLGVTVERPDRYRIGLLSETIAVVDETTFDMWQGASRVGSLWDIARIQAMAAEALGDPVDTTLDGLLLRLHVLMANGCGYLDFGTSATST